MGVPSSTSLSALSKTNLPSLGTTGYIQLLYITNSSILPKNEPELFPTVIADVEVCGGTGVPLLLYQFLPVPSVAGAALDIKPDWSTNAPLIYSLQLPDFNSLSMVTITQVGVCPSVIMSGPASATYGLEPV